MQILKLCRSCMKEVASWELENFEANTASMFTFCTNIEITEDDELPKQFCYGCTIKIESSYTFIKKAQEVNVTLKNLVGEETSVIVKSENSINIIQFNGPNSPESALSFDSEDKIDKSEDNIFSSNSNEECEIKVDEHEINESLDTKDLELPDMTLDTNTDDFDSEPEEITYEYEYPTTLQSMRQIKVEKTLSNNTGNEQNKTKKYNIKKNSKIVAGVNAIRKRKYNTRSKIEQSHEVNNKGKGKEKQNVNKDTLFKCPICKTNAFRYESTLQKHMETKHSKCKKEKDEDESKEQEEKGDNTNPDLKTCDICERTFTSKLWFSRHIENEHSDSIKQYSCPHCAKTFPSKYKLRYHKDRHAESRRFACAACGARFRMRKQLAAHARTHDPSRPHVCATCAMTFKTRSTLNTHMKLHLDERPFLCSLCGFSTKLLYTLNEHILTHTGEKPHACNECSFRTASVRSLRRHRLRHRGDRRHECQQCGKRFYEPGALERHMRTHTGERPFHCYLCTQTFTDGWNVKTHLMRVHRIPLEEIPRLRRMEPTINELTTNQKPVKETTTKRKPAKETTTKRKPANEPATKRKPAKE